jgi:hypothetical protein
LQKEEAYVKNRRGFALGKGSSLAVVPAAANKYEEYMKPSAGYEGGQKEERVAEFPF